MLHSPTVNFGITSYYVIGWHLSCLALGNWLQKMVMGISHSVLLRLHRPNKTVMTESERLKVILWFKRIPPDLDKVCPASLNFTRSLHWSYFSKLLLCKVREALDQVFPFFTIPILPRIFHFNKLGMKSASGQHLFPSYCRTGGASTVGLSGVLCAPPPFPPHWCLCWKQ